MGNYIICSAFQADSSTAHCFLLLACIITGVCLDGESQENKMAAVELI